MAERKEDNEEQAAQKRWRLAFFSQAKYFRSVDRGMESKAGWPVKLPRLLVTLCGTIALLLGAIVIFGWHTHRLKILHLHSSFAAMQYLTATCFVLCGAGLLARATKRDTTLKICGVIVTLFSLVLTIEYATGKSLGIARVVDMLPSPPGELPARPSPPTSLSFLLCGVAMCATAFREYFRWHRLAVWTCASLAASIAFMALFGYGTGLVGTYVWGPFIGIALHTAAGMLVVSAGLIAGLFYKSRSLIEDRWIAIPIFLAGLTASYVLFQALIENGRRAELARTALVADDLAEDIRSRINGPIRALERLAQRWNDANGTPEQQWRKDAERYIADEPVFSTLELVGSDYRVKWVVPDSLQFLVGVDLRRENRWKAAQALAEASANNTTAFSPPLFLKQGGRGFFAYVPLYANGKPDGFLGAALRYRNIIELVLDEPQFAEYRVTVFEGEARIYGTQPDVEAVESETSFHGQTWKLLVSPRKAFSAGQVGRLPFLVLGLCILLSVALATAAQLIRRLSWQAENIARVNASLKREVVQRKAAEEKSREEARNAEKGRVLLEAASRVARLGYWELPVDSGKPIWSASTYEIHQVEPDRELTAKEAIEFYHPEDRQRVSGAVEASMKTGSAFDFEARLITGGGEEIWVHVRGEAYRDESGAIKSLRGVIQDVDMRHRAADLLENRAQQLEEAKQSAEANARAKAEFLANMSHEIRTPLNAVIGMSDILVGSELDPRDRELADTIRASGEMLLDLINNILDFSKIESGQLELESAPFLLRDCVEHALDVVAGPASRKGLDLLYWIDPAIPPGIRGDLTRLRQILVNLAANAVKFTEKGEVFVKVSPDKTERGQTMLRFEVKDSGEGIPADRMDRLFHAFSQVDASTTRRHGGTGLGLAISHRLVTVMGGKIEVTSEPGKGSVFAFEIPLIAAEISDPIGLGKREASSLKGVRVLIVDDNETNRWILQEHTTAWGMIPTTAESGKEALQLIDGETSPQLAILDVVMPEMDGYSLAAEIRKIRSAAQLPIIILSSIGDEKQDIRSLGIAEVLTKPVKSTPLFNALTRIISDHTEEKSGVIEEDESQFAANHPVRILMVEDNRVNQRVSQLLLQKLGYEMACANNGHEALAKVSEEDFDVIFMDIQMPEMDGLEATREIHKVIAPAKRPWIIALTAHAIEGDREDCIAAGMDDYLSKPIRREHLKRALTRAFHSRNNR